MDEQRPLGAPTAAPVPDNVGEHECGEWICHQGEFELPQRQYAKFQSI